MAPNLALAQRVRHATSLSRIAFSPLALVESSVARGGKQLGTERALVRGFGLLRLEAWPGS